MSHSTDVGCISKETSMRKLLLIGIAVLAASPVMAQSSGPGLGFFGGGGFGRVVQPPVKRLCLLNGRTIGADYEAAARGIPCVSPPGKLGKLRR